MGNSYTISKTPQSRRKSESKGKADVKPAAEPVSAPETFNYETYGKTEKSRARIALTHEQLVQGIIFSEIIGPPVSKRNRTK